MNPFSESVCQTEMNQAEGTYSSNPPPAISPQIEEKDDSLIETDDDFNLDGFQVVRREFFAHTNEPAATLCNFKFYVNSACLQKFPDTQYVLPAVNQETKVMVLIPCSESERDSLMWCTVPKGGSKRKPKQMSCRLFFAKVFSMMGWNPEYRYKVLGKLIRTENLVLVAFDLNVCEVYRRITSTGAKAKMSRTPVLLDDSQNMFGPSYKDHRKLMEINLRDGFVVYSLSTDAADNAASDASESIDSQSGGAESNG